jgi:hypothetical protein
VRPCERYVIGALGLALLGCARPAPMRASFHSDDVNERILAIRQAADAKDPSTVPLLVDRLEDEDEAVRFFAILALDRITGQRFGYDYGHSAGRRAAAVERWRAYVEDPRRAVSLEAEDTRGRDVKPSASTNY